jgi:LysR family glycine cleavage system transcriptional activator
MRKIPPLNALKIFDIASKYHSFSQAAEENHMTKGAISQQIKVLEDWFGFKLFDRNSKGIELTENGHKLMDTCDLIFSLVEKQCMELKVQKNNSNEIIIGCSSSLLSYWFLPKFDSLFNSNRNINIKYNSKASFEDLIKDEIDLFISGEKFIPNNDLNYELIFKDEIGLVCSKNYVKKLINSDSEVITLLHSKSRYSAWVEWCSVSGIKLNISNEIEFDKLSLALDAVKLNLGITVAPRFVVENDIDNGILFAPFDFINCRSGTYLYTRKDMPAGIRKFVDEITVKIKQKLSTTE